MAKTFSGKQVVSLLEKIYGFQIVHQKGSHVKLRKDADAEIITTVVPLHKELAMGTLHGILRLAKIDFLDFSQKSR